MRKSIAVLAGVVAALASLSPAADWPQWRGPKRDGRSADEGLLKAWPEGGPKRLWQADIGIGFSSPIIVGDTVYITGGEGDRLTVTALDAKGARKWRVPHGAVWTGKRSPGAMGSPTFDAGRLYVLGGLGLLKCYDAATGAEKWAVDIHRQFGGARSGYGYAESPLVYKNAVIVTPGGRNCLVALNKMTGAPGWTSTGLADKAGHSSAIVVEMGPAALIVQITGRAMVGLDAPTGRMLWRNERAVDRGIPCCTPVHADGYCFGATGYGKGGACVKLSAGGGGVTARQVWDTKDMICHHGGYVVHDGHIYGNHLGGWSCLELTTGRKKWYSRGVGKGSLCYADGMLYTFGESRGRMGLVRATPSGFEQTGEFSVAGSGPSWAHPVVTGGRLYLRYHDKLYCFDVRGPNYREAPVVKPVPRPRPATRPAPVPRPPPPPSDAASDAAAKLKVARVYLNAGLKDKAKAILTDLVKRHPDTDAAKEAQAELDRLD